MYVCKPLDSASSKWKICIASWGGGEVRVGKSKIWVPGLVRKIRVTC